MENGHCISEDKSNACDIKKTRSLQGSFALFNYTRKYNRFEAFLTISLMFSFHDTGYCYIKQLRPLDNF